MQKLENHPRDKWNTGDGVSITFSEIISLVGQNPSGHIHIGTDSQIKDGSTNYAIAICIVNPSRGGRYFFCKIMQKSHHPLSIGLRLQKEVQHSIEIAQHIQCYIDISRISVHVDANENPIHASSKYTSGLINYVKSMGYRCFIKPYSWASFSVADRHTK